MNVDWFSKTPGGIPSAECEDGSTMMVFGAEVPDQVRLPAELGGHVVRVLGSFVAKSPRSDRMVRHLQLEGGMYVAEDDQFYWYKKS